VNIFSFMNKISGIFNERGGFSNKGLNLIKKETGERMGGGSNGATIGRRGMSFLCILGCP
jgi:hypothetical protein